MRVAAHQPHYWPWMGYLDKMRACDVLVVMDTAQYVRGYINRNRIMVGGKKSWITVPVDAHGRPPIRDVRVSGTRWISSHVKALASSYRGFTRSPARAVYELKSGFLVDWCMKTMDVLRDFYGIRSRMVMESDLGDMGLGTERFVNICEALGADTYLSGPSGRNYIDESMMGDVTVEYMKKRSADDLSSLHHMLFGERRAGATLG